MSTPPLSPIRKAWYQWKALRLPWRKRFFVGLDLQNNSFWEFRDAITAGRMRRIVQTPSSIQYSDVKISPQWHQWLRHTREDAPSIEELMGDIARQERLKVLARQADERWNAKASFLDQPATRQQALPATQVRDGGAYTRMDPRGDGKGVANAVASEAGEVEKERVVTTDKPASSETQYDATTQPREEKKYKDDPWKKARGGPSEEWQPKAWDPNDMPAARR
ncbi:uncharacterized protein EAF01_010729 [Botrytis porri]|uniref:Uncharacterized protein n=1 Tax=Botrytis porri TaxID=87229 RepID=A0A4Z1KSX3_9HELO|nr:uncharacterized protein EAF01_010729 [Botrytis porri]KAF7890920.1 hypothetical protein EAF01_010729 [Botrytis porri]TGO86515.1 hypothetical protein BPOR_0297g00050 [Botrytis porri]